MGHREAFGVPARLPTPPPAATQPRQMQCHRRPMNGALRGREAQRFALPPWAQHPQRRPAPAPRPQRCPARVPTRVAVRARIPARASVRPRLRPRPGDRRRALVQPSRLRALVQPSRLRCLQGVIRRCALWVSPFPPTEHASPHAARWAAVQARRRVVVVSMHPAPLPGSAWTTSAARSSVRPTQRLQEFRKLQATTVLDSRGVAQFRPRAPRPCAPRPRPPQRHAQHEPTPPYAPPRWAGCCPKSTRVGRARRRRQPDPGLVAARSWILAKQLTQLGARVAQAALGSLEAALRDGRNLLDAQVAFGL